MEKNWKKARFFFFPYSLPHGESENGQMILDIYAWRKFIEVVGRTVDLSE